jgi:hypothetical protein
MLRAFTVWNSALHFHKTQKNANTQTANDSFNVMTTGDGCIEGARTTPRMCTEISGSVTPPSDLSGYIYIILSPLFPAGT